MRLGGRLDFSNRDMLGYPGWMNGVSDTLCKSLFSAQLDVPSQWVVTSSSSSNSSHPVQGYQVCP